MILAGNDNYINCVNIMGGQQSSIEMDENRINESVDRKRKREDDDEDDMSIGSMDSYSERSMESEPDDFLDIKKDCCRENLDCHENYFLIKLHEEKIEQTKVEKEPFAADLNIA